MKRHEEVPGIVVKLEAEGQIKRHRSHLEQGTRHHDTDKLKDLDPDKKFNLLCELNVIEQVTNVCNTTIVQNAWKNGAELSIHGWIYSLRNGILKELTPCISSREDFIQRRDIEKM